MSYSCAIDVLQQCSSCAIQVLHMFLSLPVTRYQYHIKLAERGTVTKSILALNLLLICIASVIHHS